MLSHRVDVGCLVGARAVFTVALAEMGISVSCAVQTGAETSGVFRSHLGIFKSNSLIKDIA